jgi:hypothetical protein
MGYKSSCGAERADLCHEDKQRFHWPGNSTHHLSPSLVVISCKRTLLLSLLVEINSLSSLFMSSDHRNKTLSPRSHKSHPPAIITPEQSQFTLGIYSSPTDQCNGSQSSSTQFHSITPQSFQQALGIGDPSNPAFHSRPRQRRPGFSCNT